MQKILNELNRMLDRAIAQDNHRDYEALKAAETKSAEQAIRDAFRALPNVALGEFYPITVQHNGREQQFLASQRAIKRSNQPHAALTLLQIRQGRMIAGSDLQDIAYTYKLNGKNEFTEESVKPASDGQIKRWSDAFAPATGTRPITRADVEAAQQQEATPEAPPKTLKEGFERVRAKKAVMACVMRVQKKDARHG